MKKAKNRLIAILLLFLLSSSSFIFYNSVENNASNKIIQDINSPRLSNPDKSLLHSYDFEDETIGQDPTYQTLSVNEATGCTANIETLADGQQKHLSLHKVGSTGRVWVRDNFSRFGETYSAGEYHLKVYHDASGFGINLNSANSETILAMVWWNGEIRDDVGGTLLASYAYDQWLDVVIYFNLSLGWMFDLEGVRYGVGYSFSFFGAFTANAEHIWMTSFISGGGDGYFRVDDIAFYYETENLINIFTPESKEYKKPMDGYYPATYGFENDKYGEQAQGWWTQNEANCDSQIIDNYNGHNDVYELSDNNPSDKADVLNTFENKTYGTIEVWFLHSATSYYSGISLSYRDPYVNMIFIQIIPGNYLVVYNGTNPTPITITELGTIQADSWYHLRVDFRMAGAPFYMGLSEDSYIVYLNGTKANEELTLISTGLPINEINFHTGWSSAGPDQLFYFDAVGYSWDPYYELGDNLYEGLLLSYKNSTSFDWQGYSLDGQNNRTILGNSTIQMPEEGIHSIQVFGNDSLGDMYHSDLRHFTVDFPIDIITPEAKIYTGPMSGYYPGTYGFENVKDGALPTDWIFNWDGTSYIEVDDTKDGHHKVLEVRKIDDGVQYSGGTKIFENNATAGTVEFWLYKDTNGATDATKIDVKGEGGNVRLLIENQDLFRGDYGSRVLLASDVFMINTWYHIRIDFNISQGGWQVQLDNTWYGSGYTIPFTGTPTEFWGFGIGSHWSGCNNNYGAWLDALSYSWDPNYNIGDNLNEGLLLSYENSTDLDWQGYSLDGQPINTIMGNTTIPLPEDGSHFIRVFGNDSLGTGYQSNIRRFSVHHISIVTPENKTYIGPMSGYYPGTFGFDNINLSNGLEIFLQESGTNHTYINQFNEHSGVMKVTTIGNGSQIGMEHNFTDISTGIHFIEFWFYCAQSDRLRVNLGEGLNSTIGFLWRDDGLIRRWTGTDMQTVGTWTEDNWHHIKIEIDADNEKYWLYYDGLELITNEDYVIAGLDINRIEFIWGWNTGSITENYLDALGFTWQENYNQGDNLNEGLLLSYENSTALDWQGYSLDGQPINTIMGNTTIPLPDVGEHTIQVFANDSYGLNYFSDIRYFTIDYAIDIITPENKTYTGPMSGYYPATYGFESDLPGADAKNWTHAVIGGTHSYIVDSYNGHERVYELFDNAAGNPDTYTYFNNQTSGTVEAWVLVSLSNYIIYFDINQGPSPVVRLVLVTGANLIAYNNSVSVDMTEFGIIQEDQWYHIRVDFRSALAGSYMGLASDSYRIYLNGVQCNSDLIVNVPSAQVNRVTFTTGWTAADPNYYVYFDAVGFSWDPYYEVGDNLNEGLLLSYENSTVLDWLGYSLDGQPINTIMGNTTIPLPEDGPHFISVSGNDSMGTRYQSTIRHFSVHHISIISPQEKLYTGPMSGYYPSIYGFECDPNDNFPKGWTDSSGANGYSKVIDAIGGHNKVLECYSSSLDDSRIDMSNFFDPQVNGSFEFWWYKSSSYTSAAIVDFWGETPGVCISIRVDHWPSADNDKVQYQTGAGYLDTGYPYYTDNKWMHFRIDFDCSSDTYSLWIDQVKYLDNIDFINLKDETGVNQIRFDSYNAANAVLYYVDAVGFSWDYGYSVGDNLNEGLLLSYDNSTTLDWQGYSLDGQPITTIMGNVTIPLPVEGEHTIQVFANDSLGLNYFSEIRHFTVNITQAIDSIAPVITINLPTQNALFGSGAPSYNITVIELNLNSMWYTLDGGLVNTTITEPTGTFDQTLWNNRLNGTVYFRFYANDTVGNVGFEDVEVRKDILAPQISINNPIQNQLFDHTAPSFDLTIFEGNLDAVWYTLDGGLVNTTISGPTGTIDQILWNNRPNGTVDIRYYAEDLAGNVGFEEVEVSKDILPPQITINNPIQNQVFYDTAPSFDLTILEGNLDAIWYTLDDGITNFSCDLSGNFNNLYWNAIPPGVYTLKFYATDTLGNLGSSEVIVEKKEPVIPGYNPLLVSLIIVVGIMGISLKIKKKSK